MPQDNCLETEMSVLAGIISHSEQLIRNKKILHSELFSTPEHKTIYEVVIKNLEEERQVNATVITSKLHSLGYKDRQNKLLSKYVEAICYTPPEPESITELIAQLVELHYQRKGKQTCTKIENILTQDLSLPDKYNLINEAFVDGMRVPVTQGDKPVKIWDGYIEQLEYDAAHPEEKEIIGYDWPYESFNDSYGKLRRGCVHVVVARGGCGKSTMLNHVAHHLHSNHNLPILILDTEMETKTVQHRMFASASGASVYSLEENKWFQNEETKSKVYKASENIKEDDEIYHIYVGGKTIEEIEAITLDFYYTVVGNGNPFVMIYDYIKCDSKSLRNNWSEHQALGDHVDKLHQLARSLNCVVLTAAQANRSGDSFSSKNSAGIADDSTAIADSDRIQRYAEFVAILRIKTVEDIALDEPDIDQEDEEQADLQRATDPLSLRGGTHMVTVVKSRHGGKNSPGHLDFVDRIGSNGKMVTTRNYINLTFHNFNIIDRGDLRTLVNEQSEDHDLSILTDE